MLHQAVSGSHALGTRCSKEPMLDDIPDGDAFKLQLARSIERANLCKVDQDQVDTISKVVDPGKVNNE